MLCSCSLGTETTFYFFYPAEITSFTAQLLNELSIVSNNYYFSEAIWPSKCNPVWGQKLWEQQKSKYDGDTNFDMNSNQSILSATIESIRFKRFNEWFFWAILSKILDNPVYKTFSKILLFFYHLLFLFIKYTKRFNESLF